MSQSQAKVPSGSAGRHIPTGAKLALKALKDAVALPGLKALADAALRVLDLKDELGNKMEDCAALVDRIEAITTIILRGARDRPGFETDHGFKEDVEQLQESISTIEAFLKALSKRPISNRLVQNADIAAQIRKKRAELEDAISLFQLKSTFDLRISRNNLDGDRMAEQIPAFATLSPDTAVYLLPPKPAVFVGRDDIISSIVAIMTAGPEAETHIAILGAGGIGKTSVATTVLHDHRIVDKFGVHRFFIACDGVTSATGIISLLAVALKTGRRENLHEAVFNHLHMLQEPCLLILDNLESAWDTSDRRNVEELLASLAGIEMVQAMVTMRGTQRPEGPKWTLVDPLAALDLPSARQLFLEICGKEDENLDKLLIALDCWPLAVRLMAKLAESSGSPTSLLDRWKEEQTSMLTRGSNHRLSSLEISINVSLKSQSMQKEPALELLSLISFLPDGVQLNRLNNIFPSLHLLQQATHSLQESALAYTDGSGTLKVLSPIRLFMIKHHPPSFQHLSELQRYYMNMTSRLPVGNVGNDEETQVYIQELNNLQAILRDMVIKASHSDMPPIVTATLAIARFVRRAWLIGSSDQLLQLVIGRLQNSEQPVKKKSRVGHSWLKRLWCFSGQVPPLLESLQECLAALGESFYRQGFYTKAFDLFNKAQEICKQIQNYSGEASCLRSLGEVLRMQEQLDKAHAMLEEARWMSQKISDQHGEAFCLRALGNVLSKQNQYDKAHAMLEEARQMSQKIGDQSGEAYCLRSLGNILSMQEQYEEAHVMLKEALWMSQKIGDQYREASCLRSLGQILGKQNRYNDACAVIEEAHLMSKKISDQYGEAWSMLGLANILEEQGQSVQAGTMLQNAQDIFLRIGVPSGQACCIALLEKLLSTAKAENGAES